jgi:hypothetical protein
MINVMKELHLIGLHTIVWGHAVVQLFETLLQKLEGRGIDSRLGHWIFQFTKSWG